MISKKMYSIFSFCFLIVISTLHSQPAQLFPGGRYNNAISTPWEFVGHQFGRLHTFQWEMENYLHYVAERSDRVKLVRYGKTYEGRNLYLVIISSPQNLARLEEIRRANLALTDPRKTSPQQAQQTADWLPTLVWLGYNIHGNEASGMEAALQTIYQLVAGEDEITQGILKNVVCLVDPVQNPDGHDRFVQHVRSVVVKESRPNPDDMEHQSPWPGGRTNHYYFDLNRDFFLQTQIESKQRIAMYHRWMPHVFADLHEMGSNSTYFFAPPMSPYNQYVTPLLRKWWNIFARGNAAAFDRFGWGYYTHESFDAFYPGYGVSYPSINGAIGMTYEQASARGVSSERDDGTVLTLKEAAWHHFTSSMATLQTAAARRKERVLDFYQFFADALTSAQSDPLKEIILLPGKDTEPLAKLIELLKPMGVEIQQAQQPFKTKAHSYWHPGQTRTEFPGGCVLINTQQPQYVLIKSLLAPEAPLSKEFIAEERKRRENRERSHFYDITAWSLPLTFGVDAYWAEKSSRVPMSTIENVSARHHVSTLAPAKQAYLIPFHSLAATKLLAQLFRENFRVRMATKSFTLNDRRFSPGTLVLRVNRNPDTLHQALQRLQERFRTEIIPVNHGLSEAGVDLGSNTIRTLKKPQIALLTGEPVSAYSNGAIQYLFEQQFGIQFIRLPLSRWQNLSRYNVLILPDGNYQRAFTNNHWKQLKAFLRNGGNLIAMGRAVTAIADSAVGISKIRRFQARDNSGKPKQLPATPGAIYRVKLDSRSYISFGSPETVATLVRSRTLFSPFSNPHQNIGVLEKRLSGFVWPETEKHLTGKLFLAQENFGRGNVILFTEDPNFRASYVGLNKLFTNAVLLSPSF